MAYRFGDVCVDIARLAVSRAGTPVPLEPKAFDVLRLLIEHRDRLVAKDELLDAVWRDTFVTPNVLTRAIAQLRKALGDDAQEARYIETVTKRGYRFIAEVTVETDPPAIAVPAPAPSASASAPALSVPAPSEPASEPAAAAALSAVPAVAAVPAAPADHPSTPASASAPGSAPRPDPREPPPLAWRGWPRPASQRSS